MAETIRYTVGDVVQFDIPRGDSKNFYVQWTTGTSHPGTPVDLTGYTAEILDSDYNAIDAAASISNAATGTVLVHFSATQSLNGTDQFYRLRLTQGGNKTTLLEGRINIK